METNGCLEKHKNILNYPLITGKPALKIVKMLSTYAQTPECSGMNCPGGNKVIIFP